MHCVLFITYYIINMDAEGTYYFCINFCIIFCNLVLEHASFWLPCDHHIKYLFLNQQKYLHVASKDFSFLYA